MDLTGIHHLTAISANISENRRFFAETLGMRLVKRSVNQDDTSSYHLFYADGKASPGTDVTFFDWPMSRERRGTRSIVRTNLRVAGGTALAWWDNHFREVGVTASGIAERDGRLTLDFEDFEGQRLSLIDDGGEGESNPWEHSTVPAPYQIRGLGPIHLSVSDLKPTDAVLQKVMNMRPVREYAHPDIPDHPIHVYEMGAGGASAEIHVVTQLNLPAGRQGAGGVHHVAFRTPTFEEHAAWIERLNEFHVGNSGLVDRYYFRSLYFREPNGILFEIASDGPGFAVDEDEATLGEHLALPPFLESKRESIESKLKPID